MTTILPSDAAPNPFPFRPESPIPQRGSSAKWMLRVCLITLALIPGIALSIRYYQQQAEEAEFRAALDADRTKLASGQWPEQCDALIRLTKLGPKATPALPEVIALLDAPDRPGDTSDFVIPCLEAIDPAWRVRPDALRLATVWIRRMVECVDPKKKSADHWDQPWRIAKWTDSIRRLERVAQYHSDFWKDALAANAQEPDGIPLSGRRELIVPLAREMRLLPKLAVEFLAEVDPDWANGPEFDETEVGLFFNALVTRFGADPEKGIVEFVSRVPLKKAFPRLMDYSNWNISKRGGKRAAPLVGLLIERIAAEQTPEFAVATWARVLRPIDRDWVKHPSAAAMIPTLLAALIMPGQGDLGIINTDADQWFPAAWASADLPSVDWNWRENPAVGPAVAKCVEQFTDRREANHISSRFAAVRALALIGPPARSAIPELVKASVEFALLDWERKRDTAVLVKSDGEQFTEQVTAALERIDADWLESKEAQTAIPKLAEWAADTNPTHDGIRNTDGHRVAVIRLLGHFGPAAQEAIPKLKKVREKDGAGFIRTEAGLALRAIENL